MDLRETQRHWDELGRKDPYWAVLSEPGKEHGHWDEEAFFATGRAQVDSLRLEAERLGLAWPRGGSVLDFGCGVGRLSQALAGLHEEVVGLDIAASMLERARSRDRSQGRCHFVLNEAPHLAMFNEGRFDLVLTFIVLQHLAPDLALGYVTEFVRVLKPGGLLVFQLPERMEDSRLRRALKKATPRPLIRLYRRLRYGPWALDAEVEMNGVPSKDVLQCLQAAGTEVKHAKDGWYWAVKAR